MQKASMYLLSKFPLFSIMNKIVEIFHILTASLASKSHCYLKQPLKMGTNTSIVTEDLQQSE